MEIIKPYSGKTDLSRKKVIMAAVKHDMDALVKTAGFAKNDFAHLYMSRVYSNSDIAVAGPFMGAPYAVMILENLIKWGAEEVLFLGWAGSIKDDTSIGDIIVPKGAFVQEGTSTNYTENEYVCPDRNLNSELKESLKSSKICFKERKIWTTDGVFRETMDKVRKFSGLGASCVEMELSAVLNVARFREIKAASLLVISDEIYTGEYKTGHRNPAFKEARQTVYNFLCSLKDIVH